MAAASTGKSAKKKKKHSKKDTANEWIKSILIALLLALLTRATVVQAFRIPTGSMEQTLLEGDFLLANRFLYGSQIPFTDVRLPAVREPKRGDIIIFEHPSEGKDFIKRCVALPGDRVEIRNDVLYVNGEAVDEPYKKLSTFGGSLANYGPVIVPEDHLFMLGDNRHNSYDSRSWGPLDEKYIKGKAMVIYFSWNGEAHFPRFTRMGKIIR
ncbi:MAG: signal peptidase I [bacterium]|jgi:signal peptidase I